MLAVWAALAAIFLAAIFSARHVVLASIVAGKAGWMDGVLPLIGSKSKPSLSSPLQPANQRADQTALTLRLAISRLPPQPQTYGKEFPLFSFRFFLFFHQIFFSPALSLQATLFFFLFTPTLLSCSFSLSDSADVSRVRRCDLNLGRNPEDVVHFIVWK